MSESAGSMANRAASADILQAPIKARGIEFAMKPITCTCAPHGVLHHVSCPVGRLMLEAAQRAHSGLDVASGLVAFSPGFLKRMSREEANALAGRRADRRFVRPEVARLCGWSPLPVKAAKRRVKASKSTSRPKAPPAYRSA